MRYFVGCNDSRIGGLKVISQDAQGRNYADGARLFPASSVSASCSQWQVPISLMTLKVFHFSPAKHPIGIFQIVVYGSRVINTV